MTAKKRNPHVKVVFDTSALFTGSASDLVSSAIATLVRGYSVPSDVTLSWHLPSVVVQEREYQMSKAGQSLLPPIEKLERLLGHNLNITAEIINTRVKETIQRQLEDLKFELIEFNASDVIWEEMIEASLFRQPPFDSGEKEKGFRDALIAECFMQLVKASPSTPRYCRVVMLTKDGLLSSHLQERTRTNKNVKIFTDIKDLRGLINTLVSEVKEELIDKVQPKAQAFFFVPNNKDTYYFTENVRDTVSNQYKAELEQKAPGSDIRDNGTWYISKPEFLSKSGQRITWSTRIDIESKCYTQAEPSEETESPALGISGISSYAKFARHSPLLRGVLSEKGDLVADGRTTFEVVWSVLVSTNVKFRNPKIEHVNFTEIDWSDKLGD